jgi:hypothetical protein
MKLDKSEASRPWAQGDSIGLYLSGGRTAMDRVSESLLQEFSTERGLSLLSEE